MIKLYSVLVYTLMILASLLVNGCSHSRWDYPFERKPQILTENGVKFIKACAVTPITAEWRKGREGQGRHNVDHHVVAVNEDGDLRAAYDEDCPIEFEEHFAGIMKGLNDYAVREILPESTIETQQGAQPESINPCYKRRQRTIKIMVFVHGGLVAHEDGIGRAETRTPDILCGNESDLDNHYPVFFVWNTKALDTYSEQIFWLRDGEKQRRRRYDQAALHVVSDIGSGVFRAPLQYLRAAERFVDLRIKPFVTQNRSNNYGAILDANQKNEFDIYGDYKYRYRCNGNGKDCVNQAFGNGQNVIYPDDGEWGLSKKNPNDREIKAGYVLRYPLVTLPTGFVTPAVDGFGRTAWANMRRRTFNTIRRPSEMSEDQRREQKEARNERITALSREVSNFTKEDQWYYTDMDQEVANYPQGTGGFAKFMAALERCFQWRNSIDTTSILDAEKITQCSPLFSPDKRHEYDIEVDFVGHSMGAIVLNQLLPGFEDVPKTNIVYMAAADNIANSYRALLPILSAAENGTPNDTLFFNLMLHPKAETLDQYAAGLVPEGSLLEWIDEFLGDSQSIPLKTFGKWRNVREIKPRISADIEDRMVFRVYSANNRPEDLYSPGLNPDRKCIFYAIQKDRRKKVKKDDRLEVGPDGRCYPISHGDFENFGFWQRSFWRGPYRLPPEVKRARETAIMRGKRLDRNDSGD